ncbi:MAG: GlsB/YeaQ/YmgE family stress response membrane protein [Candidatus Peribacteraceae bacterium]|nr:GlsB/YeaQ/YmgE family stress response membrane protein [Candidatus Peribacteraceae bacterium]
MDLIGFLIIGLVAGWLADMIVKNSSYGLLGDLIVGVIGAFIGGWVFGAVGLEAYGIIGSLISATVGAILLLLLLNFIGRKA